MVLADFTITVEFETTPREVRVVVYDDPKGLRIAATKYENLGVRKQRRRRGRYADTLGICHRFERIARDGSPHPECAIVRLAKPNLGAGILSHELAHAAVWMRELNQDTEPLTCANDETFAWVLGELVRQTTVMLYEKGVYV